MANLILDPAKLQDKTVFAIIVSRNPLYSHSKLRLAEGHRKLGRVDINHKRGVGRHRKETEIKRLTLPLPTSSSARKAEQNKKKSQR